MKYLSALFLLFSLSLSPFLIAQRLVCDTLHISLMDVAAGDTSFADLKYQLHVRMNLSVENNDSDTLVLKTNVKISQGLEPKNLQAFCVDSDGTERHLQTQVKSLPAALPMMEDQELIIILPDQKCTDLVVGYDVIGTGFFFSRFADNYPNVLTYYPREEYIYPMNIQIKETRIHVPGSFRFFADREMCFDSCIGQVNLTCFNSAAFTKEDKQYGKATISVYIPDTLSSEMKYQEKLNTFYSYLSNLSDFYPSPRNLNMLMINWRDDDARQAFGVSFRSHSVVDINLTAEGMLHEMIHQSFPVYVKSPSKGEFLIKESLIEWLTMYITNQTESIKTDIKPAGGQNLFDAVVNNNETRSLIYQYGPALLQQMAANGNEKQMAGAIISFLSDKDAQLTDYTEFINHLSRYFPQTAIKELDTKVRGI